MSEPVRLLRHEYDALISFVTDELAKDRVAKAIYPAMRQALESSIVKLEALRAQRR